MVVTCHGTLSSVEAAFRRRCCMVRHCEVRPRCTALVQLLRKLRTLILSKQLKLTAEALTSDLVLQTLKTLRHNRITTRRNNLVKACAIPRVENNMPVRVQEKRLQNYFQIWGKLFTLPAGKPMFRTPRRVHYGCSTPTQMLTRKSHALGQVHSQLQPPTTHLRLKIYQIFALW